MREIIIAILGISVFGCATTTTGPTPAGKDQYVMSRQEGAFPSGKEPLLKEVIEEASVFCDSLEREIELIDSYEDQRPIGNFPKATIRFKCL